MRRYISDLIQDRRNSALDAVPKFLLWLGSLIYAQAMRWRNRGYDRDPARCVDVGVPVISVGNITMGGAGKTPLVVFIAQFLRESGAKPVVLLRGYMQDDRSTEHSDEAELIRRKLPGVEVITGSDRVARAREYLRERECDVFVLDDAFQHRRIKRQLDIVVIDCLNPFGNGQVIPRGILREPLDGLRRADLTVLARTGLDPERTRRTVNRIAGILPQSEPVRTVHRPRALVSLAGGGETPVREISGLRCVAFCGLGNPEGFRATLLSLGADIAEFIAFEDHHPYGPADMDRLREAARAHDVPVLITTLKDAVKIEPLLPKTGGPEIKYVDIEIEITHGKDKFIDRIRSVLRR